MMVVKNTLLHKALEQLEGDYSELYPALTGTTAMLFSNVGNAPAKANQGVPQERNQSCQF